MKSFEKEGEKDLIRKKPIAYNFPNQINFYIVEKVMELRKEQ